MNIQSVSVCVPAKRCINDCKFCCSKMHNSDYEDFFTDINCYASYTDDMRKRLTYARENGCNVCMLTGNNEPQQNKEFLRVFYAHKPKHGNGYAPNEITNGKIRPSIARFIRECTCNHRSNRGGNTRKLYHQRNGVKAWRNRFKNE